MICSQSGFFPLALNRKLSGWDALARKFPATDIQKTGEAYKVCGYSSGLRSNRIKMFLVEFADEGLLVTTTFARGSPILIPWSAIRGVASTNMGILGPDVAVNVECERPLGFHLPLAALTSIQKYVPAERINKGAISASSPGATLGGMINLAKNRSI